MPPDTASLTEVLSKLALDLGLGCDDGAKMLGPGGGWAEQGKNAHWGGPCAFYVGPWSLFFWGGAGRAEPGFFLSPSHPKGG